MVELSKETIGELQILLACLFFSLAFVGQRYAMTHSEIGPFTFNAVRYMASLLTLQLSTPILVRYSKIDGIDEKPDNDYVTRNGGNHSLFFWVMIAGLSNFGGSMLQQYSLTSLETAKVAFITGSFVVIIPFVEWLWPLVFGYPAYCISPRIWIGVILSFVGLYYLSGCGDEGADCLNTNSAQTIGLICVTLSVLFWTVNLMMADMASKQVDCLALTMGEFTVVIVLTTIVAIIVEPHNWVYPFKGILECWKTILIVGFCEAVAYVTSTIGQMYVRPSRASIIYSGGEALGASFFAYLLLGETLTSNEMFGGILMLVAAAVSSTTISDDDEDDSGDVIESSKLTSSAHLKLTERAADIEFQRLVVNSTGSEMVNLEHAPRTQDAHHQYHHHTHKHSIHLNAPPYAYGAVSSQ